MILGSGVDIIETKRIEQIYDKYGDKFIDRIFSKNEKEYSFSKKNKNRAMQSLAGRFAAKEAFVKALGTGVVKNINLKDIQVETDELGKPHLKFKKNFLHVSGEKIGKVHVSLSHCREYAVATVILEI